MNVALQSTRICVKTKSHLHFASVVEDQNNIIEQEEASFSC